jgi:SAM-dependent methyltransferase
MNQTPAHDHHNPDLLRFMPGTASFVIEVGCSSGALAREYRKLNSGVRYVGIEIDSEYAKLAKRYCDEVRHLDVEIADDAFFSYAASCDCWVFGDTLEHMRDPWLLLERIRGVIPASGSVVACIPNAQHWSVQVRLNRGEFRYEASGLLDRTHLRWFTRLTIMEMFQSAGFIIDSGIPRIFNEPNRARFLPAIRAMATAAGANPDVAVRDAIPLQYVIRAVPAYGKQSPNC